MGQGEEDREPAILLKAALPTDKTRGKGKCFCCGQACRRRSSLRNSIQSEPGPTKRGACFCPPLWRDRGGDVRLPPDQVDIVMAAWDRRVSVTRPPNAVGHGDLERRGRSEEHTSQLQSL